MMETISYREDSGVGFLTLNRPEARNALNRKTLGELQETVASLGPSPLRALIITGSGTAFMAGADINELSERGPVQGIAEVRRRQEVFGAIASLPYPSIAAINGYALGAGLELALACTIRIAAESAQMGLPEVSLGIIPGDGGTQRLARIIGLGHALELTLTARRIDAAEAYRMGLVSRVVPDGGVLEAALEIAKQIALNGALAVALAKESVLRGATLGMEQGLMMEAALHAVCCDSEDKKRAVAAFIERRARKAEGRQGEAKR